MTDQASAPKRRRIPWVLIGVVMFVLAFMGNTGYGIYDKRKAMALVQAAFAEYDVADARWQGAVERAMRAPPDALAVPLKEMVESEQAVAAVSAWGCAALVGEALVQLMQVSRVALAARMANDPAAEARVAESVRSGRELRLEYEIVRARCFESPRS